jgi:hypothetical protein
MQCWLIPSGQKNLRDALVCDEAGLLHEHRRAGDI